MKKVILITLVLLLTLFITLVFREKRDISYIKENVNQPKKTVYESKRDNNEGVEIEAKPLTVSGSTGTTFMMTFTTHSIELNYEIAQIAYLKDDNGTIYKPVSWTGGKGGHHLEGILTFPPLTQSARSFTLTIPQIEKYDREFSWNIK